MASPLQSLIACGTKLWLDSIDPDLVVRNRAWGATGATSNPIILSDLIKTGRFDSKLEQLMHTQADDAAIAWQMTDELVHQAQQVFSAGLARDRRQQRLRQLRARSACWKIRKRGRRMPSASSATSSWARNGRPAIRTA